MSSKLSLITLVFLLVSLFLVSSATPVGEVQLREAEKRGCTRYSCMDVIPESESSSESVASDPTPSAEPPVEAPAATPTPPAPAPAPAADVVPVQDSASTPQNSGAMFNANRPIISCFIALGMSASIFTFVL